MSSQISRILSDEHKKILRLIDALNEKSDELQSGKMIDKEFFLRAIDFIRGYADKFHHAKEEDILFKEMCKEDAQKNMHCNPIDMMLYEHDQGRNFVRGMEEGIKENNKVKIFENAKGYVNLLREHIYKEDNILYPMADEVLNKKILQKMLEKFKEVESKMKKDKEKYLNFVKSLT
ncbi:cation-binding protein [Candidatus Pacearchaeota archaeon CG10_big_fil_rev_8_21_14_0_10_32_42]|nr:MAG: cation-binding protein [Candidatus Pacearchaeota archaeon CG10_big_fil_rev_8_21_14_0_10_32_42]